jgi:multisubunit Na+/H+ antiporter MnhB subunit
VVSPIVEVIAPRLLGPALMVAAAIIVKGYTDVGDGFSAGVIVALAVALRYITLGRERTEAGLPVLKHAPAIAAAGLLAALAVGFFPVALGEPPFTHFPRAGDDVIHIGTLELLTAVAFDLGLFLLVAGTLVVLVHQLADLVEEDAHG